MAVEQNNPLDGYRKKAQFDSQALRILLDGEEAVEFRHQILDTLARDPLFAAPKRELTVGEQQELNFLRAKRLKEYDFPISVSAAKVQAYLCALTAIDPNLPLLSGLNDGVITLEIFLGVGLVYNIATSPAFCRNHRLCWHFKA